MKINIKTSIHVVLSFLLISNLALAVPSFQDLMENSMSEIVVAGEIEKTVEKLNAFFEDPASKTIQEWIVALDGTKGKKQRKGLKNLIYAYNFDPKAMKKVEDVGIANKVVSTSFEARLKLRALLKHFTDQKEYWINNDNISKDRKPDKSLAKLDLSIRETYRMLQYLESLVAERAMWVNTAIPNTVVEKNLDPSSPKALSIKAAIFRKLTKQAYPFDPSVLKQRYSPLYAQYNADIVRGNFKLKSGDILISRGGDSVGAGIARIGDINGNYSHLILYYENPKIDGVCKNGCTIEAHTGDISITSVDKAIFHNKDTVKLAVFRYPDSEKAHQAADFMYNYVSGRESVAPILYDFQMDYENDEKFFCAEIGQYAYKTVEQIFTPLIYTSFAGAARQILEGFTGRLFTKTFAPSDMVADVQFDLVAEFTDLSRISKVNASNAIMDAIITYMNDRHYVIEPNKTLQTMVELILQGRKVDIMATASEIALTNPNLNAALAEEVLSMLGEFKAYPDAFRKVLKENVPEGLMRNAAVILVYLDGMVNEMSVVVENEERALIKEQGVSFSMDNIFHVVWMTLGHNPDRWPYFKKAN